MDLPQAQLLMSTTDLGRHWLFEDLLEEVLVFELVRNRGGEIVDWFLLGANGPARETLAISGKPAARASATAIFGPEAMAPLLEASRRAMRSGGAVRDELFLPWSGLRSRSSLFPLDAETIAVAASPRREPHTTADAGRRAEARYRGLFESNLLGVMISGLDGIVRDANDCFLRLIGRAREELPLRRGQVFAPEDATRLDVSRRGFFPLAQRQLLRSDGSRAPVLCGEMAIPGDPGEEIVGFALDISDLKRAEAALRESDQHKSEFLATLSHELRNPLAPIHNSLYLLDHAAPGSEQAGRAREVLQRQAQHLTKLVDDLLDVTRISRGKIELHHERLDLCEVVRRTCEDHRSIFEQRGIALEIAEPRPTWVEADATRMAQVIGNLLQNAGKFTPQGGTTSVSVSSRDGRAEVRVLDDGIGMQPDQVERMFEPFAQARDALARTHEGLGLGLALVKGLVELQGGSVRARSEGPGRGSEFVVSLPLAAPPPITASERPSSGRRTSRRVLIVEDNLDAGQTLGDVLELSGHQVRVACDGRTGIALARELRPDVVLCAIGLPDLSGYDVARVLRADRSLEATRLIALTGCLQPEDRARGEEAGFEAHLPKPPPIEELVDLLAAPAPHVD